MDTSAIINAAWKIYYQMDQSAHKIVDASLAIVILEDVKVIKPMEHDAIRNINVALKFVMSKFAMESVRLLLL